MAPKKLVPVFIALICAVIFAYAHVDATRPNTSIKIWEWNLPDTLEGEEDDTTSAISVVIPSSKGSKAQYTVMDWGYVIRDMAAHSNDSMIGIFEVWCKAPSYIPEWGDTVFYEYRYSDSDSTWRDSSLTDTLPPITPYAARSDRWVRIDTTWVNALSGDSLFYLADYNTRNPFRTYLPLCDSVRFIWNASSKSDSIADIDIQAVFSGNSADERQALMINKFIGGKTPKDGDNYSTNLADVDLWRNYDWHGRGQNFQNIAYTIYLVSLDTAAANDSISTVLVPYMLKHNPPVKWLGLGIDSSGMSYVPGDYSAFNDTLQGEDYLYRYKSKPITGLAEKMRIDLEDLGSEDTLRWIWFNAILTR